MLQLSLGQKIFAAAIVFAGLILGVIGGIYLLAQMGIGVSESNVGGRLASALVDFGIFKFDPFKARLCEFSKKIEMATDQIVQLSHTPKA